jgi:hypothetical protein
VEKVRSLVVLNHPASFKPQVKELTADHEVHTSDFFLSFVTAQEQLQPIASYIQAHTSGDTVVWFAYPKKSSKKYKSDLTRDVGFEELGGVGGFEVISSVAIDEDWSALRFRREEFVKSMTRRNSIAATDVTKKKKYN